MPQLRTLLATVFCALALLSAQAQRIIGELESNTDQGMIPNDPDSTKKEKKVVPVDVRAWTIDPLYGDRIDTYVDTLTHHFQNSDHPEGAFGEYATLSNLGSPRQSRIYSERRTWTDFIFAHPFDEFLVSPDRFRYYNTKSPYMNITYHWRGDKQTGADHFRALYTNNAGKRINFGGIFDYLYGQGYYDHQSTSYQGATAFASYLGDRYDFHFHYTHNYMKMAENGGITDDAFIVRPEDLPQSYDSKDIPTNLSNTWVNQEHDIIYFNHRYHIGFTRVEGDSTNLHDVFVPVSSFFHTFTMQNYRRHYRAYNQPKTYYTQRYLPGDTISDRHSMTDVRNNVGIALNEGFNRYAVAGLKAYVAFLHRSHRLPEFYGLREGKRRYNENSVYIGGQILRTQGHWLHYNLNGEYGLAGEDFGEFHLSALGELNMPILGDTAQIKLNASIQRAVPEFYYNHYHSTYAWWDRELDPMTRTRLGGTLTFPRTNTRLSVQVENVKNYAYFAMNATPHTADDGITYYTRMVAPRQASENIQVLSAQLQQDFKLGIFHLDNRITYQTSTHEDIIPVPTIITYNNLYLNFTIAKVLHCELGADLKYFTKYYAPDYSPAISQYATQSHDTRVKVGNYPLISVYANLLLKRCRFYVQYYHINKDAGRYFSAPHYPMNPDSMHFGISWNFYD